MAVEGKRIKIVKLMTEYVTKGNIAFTLLADNISGFSIGSDSLYDRS